MTDDYWHEKVVCVTEGTCPCHGYWRGTNTYSTRYAAWLAYWSEHDKLPRPNTSGVPIIPETGTNKC